MPTLERQKNPHKQVTAKAKVTVSKFSRVFALAIILFVSLNLLFVKREQKHDPSEILLQAKQEKSAGIISRHSWSWWLCKLYEEQKQAPDVVIFGSSLLGSAHASIDANFLGQLIDALTHRRVAYLEEQINKWLGQRISVFSLGSPGEMISDSYAISKTLFVSGMKPKLVIATIAPRDFVDSTLSYPAATDHYKFFSNFTDLSSLNDYAYPEFFARFGAELNRLPLKRFVSASLNAQVENVKSDWAAPESSRIEPGKAVIPAWAVPKQVDNSKEYVERFREPFGANYFSEVHFFQRWLADLKKQNIAVLVVCMPTTAANRQLLPQTFWKRFRADLSAACESNKADWYDLSESQLFQNSDYLDTVHLNAYGGMRLFPVIAQRILATTKSRIALRQSSGPNSISTDERKPAL